MKFNVVSTLFSDLGMTTSLLSMLSGEALRLNGIPMTYIYNVVTFSPCFSLRDCIKNLRLMSGLKSCFAVARCRYRQYATMYALFHSNVLCIHGVLCILDLEGLSRVNVSMVE